MSRCAIEEVQKALLGWLCDCVDGFAFMVNRQQRRWRRKIAIPYVVVYALKVPDSLAGVRVQRKQGVRKEIIPYAVIAIKIIHCRAGRYVDNPSLFIKRHASPVVRGSRNLPCFLGPCVVTIFARNRDRVESPAESACMNIEGSDIAVKGRLCLRGSKANNDHVLVDHARCGQSCEGFGKVTARKTFPKVQLAVIPECRNQLSRLRIERIKICQGSRK